MLLNSYKTVLDILKFLPETNRRDCGQQTCMVFATLVAQGAKGPDECPHVGEPEGEELRAYMTGFGFDD